MKKSKKLTIQQKGGLARKKALSPERRSEIARQGANARWAIKWEADLQKERARSAKAREGTC